MIPDNVIEDLEIPSTSNMNQGIDFENINENESQEEDETELGQGGVESSRRGSLSVGRLSFHSLRGNSNNSYQETLRFS